MTFEELDHRKKMRDAADARTAKMARVQTFVYKLLRGANWKKGGPLRRLGEKLSSLPFRMTVPEFRRLMGRSRAAGVEARHRWEKFWLLCNAWPTERKMSAGARKLNDMARKRANEVNARVQEAGGRRKRQRKGPDKPLAPVRLLPIPPPVEVHPCRYCGRFEDSKEHYLGEGKSTKGEEFTEHCEAWKNEIWAVTGVEWEPGML